MKIKEYIVVQDNDLHPQLKVKCTYEWDGTDLEDYDNVVDMLNECFNMNILSEEYAYVVSFDSMLNLKGIYQLSHGDSLKTNMRNREIFIFLLLSGADQYIVAHNHVTNCLEPSIEDQFVTREMELATQTFSIDLLEHIIICRDDYTLIKEYMEEEE